MNVVGIMSKINILSSFYKLLEQYQDYYFTRVSTALVEFVITIVCILIVWIQVGTQSITYWFESV